MSTRYTIDFVVELETDDEDERAVVRVAAKQPVEDFKAVLEAIAGVSSVVVAKKMTNGWGKRGERKPRDPKPPIAVAAE